MENSIMEKHVERLRGFLYENINSEIFDSNKALYEAFVIVEKNGKQSDFDIQCFTELLYQCMYRYNCVNGLSAAVKMELPFVIPQNITFEGFCIQMRKYLNTPFENEFIQNDNFRDVFIRFMYKLMNHNSAGGWTFLDFADIESSQKYSKNNAKKLYLSVSNKDLHSFALQLIKKSGEIGLKYDFKVNADSRYRRADNVVIYTSKEDVNNYVAMIEKIKVENPKMDFGLVHLLVKPINEYIGIADIEESGATESHSGVLCDKIIYLRNEAVTFDEFFEEIKVLVS